MTRRSSLTFTLGVVLAAALLLPSASYAQGRHARPRVVGPRTTVFVGVGGGYYYRPYYFYDPFFYPWGYYPFAWQYPPYYGGYGGYAEGSLRIQVTPRNAEVYIDGYYAGTVDDFDGTFQRLRLEPGEHDLTIWSPGYRPLAQKIYLQPDSTFRVKAAMVPLAPGESEPPRPVATPPPPPPAGQAGRPGALPPRAPRGRGPVTAPAPLPEAGTREAGYGSVTIRVQPGDATVRVDGERWEGPQGDERLIIQLSAGRHVINVQKDGYREYMTEVTVRGGETAALNVSLTRQ